MESLSIGLGNYVSASRVIAIVSPESAPVKRMVQEAKDKGLAVDSTFGRRTRAVIVMDSRGEIWDAIKMRRAGEYFVQLTPQEEEDEKRE